MAGAGFDFSGISLTSASVVSSRLAIDDAFWSAERTDLGGIDDAGLDEILEGVGRGVEAELLVLRCLDLLDHDRAFLAGILCDPAERFLRRPPNQLDADPFVVVERLVLEQLVECLRSANQRHAAAVLRGRV